MRTTSCTSHWRAGVLLEDNQLGMGFEPLNGPAGSVHQRSRHLLAMVVPCGGESLRLAESARSTERYGVLDIDRLAPPEPAAHECRGPRYQILN